MEISTGIYLRSWGQKLVLRIHVCTHATYRLVHLLAEIGEWYILSNIQQEEKQVGINKHFPQKSFLLKIGLHFNQKCHWDK